MVQIEKLIQYCKLLKYLRTAYNGKYRIAYKHRILSTDYIETISISNVIDTNWYKIYTDTRCNNYYISVKQVNAIKL